ncbi:hypothetical protein E3H11_43640, partial [Bradyrhizobium brasilense]|uniref:acetate--CoA ligase family protein n=1 Tax=Bradyrhizobium brasilense TaxID=1419277 RepID=UPI00145685A7
ADKRTSLTAPEGKVVCDAYGIPVPKEGVAKSAAEAARIASDIGFLLGQISWHLVCQKRNCQGRSRSKKIEKYRQLDILVFGM